MALTTGLPTGALGRAEVAGDQSRSISAFIDNLDGDKQLGFALLEWLQNRIAGACLFIAAPQLLFVVDQEASRLDNCFAAGLMGAFEDVVAKVVGCCVVCLDPDHVQSGHSVVEDLRLYRILHNACSDFE